MGKKRTLDGETVSKIYPEYKAFLDSRKGKLRARKVIAEEIEKKSKELKEAVTNFEGSAAYTKPNNIVSTLLKQETDLHKIGREILASHGKEMRQKAELHAGIRKVMEKDETWIKKYPLDKEYTYSAQKLICRILTRRLLREAHKQASTHTGTIHGTCAALLAVDSELNKLYKERFFTHVRNWINRTRPMEKREPQQKKKPHEPHPPKQAEASSDSGLPEPRGDSYMSYYSYNKPLQKGLASSRQRAMRRY